MPASVPLARVYDALDADAYRAFRAAMRRSRGGTVKLADLVAGLAEVAPRAIADVLRIEASAVSDLARPPSSEPDLVPMANEPALREALTAAYLRAEGRPVTPEDLAATAVVRHRVVAPIRAPHVATESGMSRVSSLPTCEWTGEAAFAVLSRWLAAQRLPRSERDGAVARIEVETNHRAYGPIPVNRSRHE